jgi:nitroreductase
MAGERGACSTPPAVALVDQIGVQLDALNAVRTVRSIRRPTEVASEHLRKMVDSTYRVPASLRRKAATRNDGRAIDPKIMLAISKEIDSVTRQLADIGALDDLAIKNHILTINMAKHPMRFLTSLA